MGNFDKLAKFSMILGLLAIPLFPASSNAQTNSKQQAKEELTKLAERFIKCATLNQDSLIYKMFSDSMLQIQRLFGLTDPVSFQEVPTGIVPFDSAQVQKVVFPGNDTANVFVKQFISEKYSGFWHSSDIYRFVRQANGWKFDGYGEKEEEKKLMIAVPLNYDGEEIKNMCAAYFLPHFYVWKLLITEHSLNGKVVYTRYFNPSMIDTINEGPDWIADMEVRWNGNFYYLVVSGEAGTGAEAIFIAERQGKFTQIATFRPELPEFVDIDNDGENEILVLQDKLPVDWSTASPDQIPDVDIYKWKNGKLTLWKTAPYSKRYCN